MSATRSMTLLIRVAAVIIPYILGSIALPSSNCPSNDVCQEAENAPSLLQSVVRNADDHPDNAEAEAAKEEKKKKELEDMQKVWDEQRVTMLRVKQKEQEEAAAEAEAYERHLKDGSYVAEVEAIERKQMDEERRKSAQQKKEEEEEFGLSDQERDELRKRRENLRQQDLNNTSIKAIAMRALNAVSDAHETVKTGIEKVQETAKELGVDEKVDQAKSTLIERFNNAQGTVDSAVDTLAAAEIAVRKGAMLSESAVRNTVNIATDMADKTAQIAVPVLVTATDTAQKSLEQGLGTMSAKAQLVSDKVQTQIEDGAIHALTRLTKAVNEQEKIRSKQMKMIKKKKNKIEKVIQEKADEVIDKVQDTMEKADRLESKIEDKMQKIVGTKGAQLSRTGSGIASEMNSIASQVTGATNKIMGKVQAKVKGKDTTPSEKDTVKKSASEVNKKPVSKPVVKTAEKSSIAEMAEAAEAAPAKMAKAAEGFVDYLTSGSAVEPPKKPAGTEVLRNANAPGAGIKHLPTNPIELMRIPTDTVEATTEVLPKISEDEMAQTLNKRIQSSLHKSPKFSSSGQKVAAVTKPKAADASAKAGASAKKEERHRVTFAAGVLQRFGDAVSQKVMSAGSQAQLMAEQAIRKGAQEAAAQLHEASLQAGNALVNASEAEMLVAKEAIAALPSQAMDYVSNSLGGDSGSTGPAKKSTDKLDAVEDDNIKAVLVRALDANMKALKHASNLQVEALRLATNAKMNESANALQGQLSIAGNMLANASQAELEVLRSATENELYSASDYLKNASEVEMLVIKEMLGQVPGRAAELLLNAAAGSDSSSDKKEVGNTGTKKERSQSKISSDKKTDDASDSAWWNTVFSTS